MADGTKIEWTDATWSVVTGCTRISEGCAHCYIERTPPFRMERRRFDGPQIGATTGVRLHEDRLFQPFHWRKPRRIFVCSMADLFHDQVPDEYIAKVFSTMARTPQHTYQVLTKRPARMRSLLNSDPFRVRVEQIGGAPVAWPLANVWGGTSVETQGWAEKRIPVLADTDLAVRWISAEPLLGYVRIHKWIDRLDWVVAGGESGPGSRPMHPNWARSLRGVCDASGTAYLFKQWGDWAVVPEEDGRSTDLYLAPGGATYTVAAEIADVRLVDDTAALMRRVGKGKAGRLLDGREWNGYPEAAGGGL